MGETSIEWTNRTWNPVTGCTKVSPGCKFCYAERVFPRAYSGMCECGDRIEAHDHNDPFRPGTPTACLNEDCKCVLYRQRVFTEVLTHPDRLDQPLHWRKPQRIFVNSMSDLFHEDVSDEFIDKVFAVMGLAPQHTFQILTKRPERMREYMNGDYLDRAWKQAPDLAGPDAPFIDWRDPLWHRMYDNVWLGVSAENQQYADERIPLLLQTPAAVRFVSYEPALGPVLFRRHIDVTRSGVIEGQILVDHISRLDWIIVGGESGPGARPMHPDWARTVRDQCEEAGVAFFFKQWGEWFPRDQWEGNPNLILPDDEDCVEGPRLRLMGPLAFHRVGKKASGALLDGELCREFPK